LLSKFEFSLLSEIVYEWSLFPTLSSCFTHWNSFKQLCSYSFSSHLRILLFNVRGLDERWEEVILLLDKYKIDCLILTEVGSFDFSVINQIFINFRYFYQKGENSWGGVMMLFKPSLPLVRVKCDTPNICVVDVKLEPVMRLIGVYAPKSKTWGWNTLSNYITDNCSVFGDFNIDLDVKADETPAKDLLDWAESCALAPVVPDSPTSLRSDRTIDYAFTRGTPLTMQTCTDNTSSDHKPIVGVVNCESKESELGSNTHWKVFNYFLSLTIDFWENESKAASSDEYYKCFINLLVGLKTRCTTYFPLKKYRAAIPKELRMKLSLTRALSFQHKRTGDVLLLKKIKEMRRNNRLELISLRSRKLMNSLKERFSSTASPNSFWSKVRKNFNTTNSLEALIDDNNAVVNDVEAMLDIAANHYENLFIESQVYRPHPYIDSPEIHWDNRYEPIPPITMPELLKALGKVKKKHSTDAHGISSYMLRFIPNNYMIPLLQIFNDSLTTFSGPAYWKHVKMKLLAKKESICSISETRPISLLDIFLKVLESLFLSRFKRVLENRGLLHDSQSGFRSNFRLQSRVLVLIDQISSLMSTSTPVATVFIDFKQAFDQLWWLGCLGKLSRLGIPKAYVSWIESWLKHRSVFIEMKDKKSRFFSVFKGGPQGSCLTPALFITYHSDMWSYLQISLPNFYADDLACVVGGMMGAKYSNQCLDVDEKLKKLFDYLEFYSTLSVQPINYKKTELLWTARAIRKPPFNIAMGEHQLTWAKSFRYLGYHLSSKLSWSKMISTYKTKIRQRVAIVRSCKLYGTSSLKLKRVLFSTYVMPLFTWLYGIFPLLTECQRDDLGHFYFTCLKRTLGNRFWNDIVFAAIYNELSLENLCWNYWSRYRKALAGSTDGFILFEQASLNLYRKLWLDKDIVIKHLRRSKRFVHFDTCIEKCLKWVESGGSNSIPMIDVRDLEILATFPETFL
jgi:hypothetical protein